MTDIFEDEEEVIEPVEDFDADEEEVELIEEVSMPCTLDARRRLENKLEEKRLQEELDDFLEK